MPQDASALEREPYDRVLFLGDPHIGKAQPLDEPVLTPTGWRSIGSLQIGDEVVGSDGQAAHVTGVFPRGVLPISKLTTDDGCFTRCCSEHLWLTATKAELRRPRWTYPSGPHQERGGKVRTEIEWGPGTVKTTEEIARTLPPAHLALKNAAPSRIHYLPRVSRPVEFTTAEHKLPIHPYFLGLLLGDGSFSSTATNVSFTSADDELIEELQAHAWALGDEAIRHDDEAHCPWVHFRGTNTRRALEALELFGCRSKNKHVPQMYLHAQPSERLELLRGLCDTDGSVVRQVSGKNQGVGLVAEFCTTSECLRDAVVFIVRSLGGRAYVRWKSTPMCQTGPGLPAWVVLLTFADGTCPFMLSRKVAAWAPLREKIYRQRIVSIEPVGEAECVCISVDAPDHLYVTRDFLVTHNSTSIVSSAAQAFGMGYVLNCGKATGLLDAARRSKKFKYDVIRDETQMEDAMKEARRGCRDGTYKWVVVDDFNLYGSWLEVALEDQTRNAKGEADGRRFWREYRKRLINILVRGFDFKAHFYVVSHYIETGTGLIEGQTEKTGQGVAPLFGGAARKEIPGNFANIVFMAPSTKDKSKRSFYVNPIGVYGPSCLDLPGTHELEADVGVLHEEFEKASKAGSSPKIETKRPNQQRK